ncbi:hypothetical protein D3C76_1629250 [compost metagenome]
MTCTAAEYGADLQFGDSRFDDRFCFIGVNQIIATCNDFFCFRMTNCLEAVSAFNTVVEIFNNLFTILDTTYRKAFICTTIIITHDYVLGYIYETTSQVT